MPHYTPAAKERAMKVRDVLVQAIAGKLSWLQAADILGLSPRTVRRLRWQMEHYGVHGLRDKRRRSPAPRAMKTAELQRWLQLYRRRYRGYNARHFWATCRREHGMTWSYTLIRTALQAPGWCASTDRGDGTGAGENRVRVGASCSTSMAAGTAGCCCVPRSTST
jgi:hypothetical protein